MGTAVSFDLRGRGDHGAAIRASVRRLHEIDARFSTYRPDSEVRRFARGELRAGEPSPDLEHVLRACERIERLSGGAFSAALPAGFDPSGYVKGWAVDVVAAILTAHGCDDWAVDAGGDVRTRRRAGAAPWRIGVRHPEDGAAVAAVVPAWDLAVATSGRYERGDHLVDPRSGGPARGALSVTVSGPELGDVDAIATAAFVLGADGPAWVAGLPDHECWAVLADGRVLATAGFPRLVAGVPVTTSPVRSILEAAA